ncbi:hypothetical protein DPEC_G00301150 [Dallia pectoralis]|uniref:Uncharacterized protein n=1 Tax=Dallia pectoralis TaxID=75939 RepID=A0ACC2FGM2_DALPE|nr:hypothetical protein DPEC_G00301150 [Dallia pectoralis]
MNLCRIQVWRWMLFAYFHWLCVCQDTQETTRPAYLVTIPAVIQAGLEATFCASLLQPRETLNMTISLVDDVHNSTLLQKSSDQEFHLCFQFQAPKLQEEKILKFKVEVRGETYVSTEERKVKIKPDSSMTFVQTDKPIYNPGQTVHFRVVTLDTNFSPVNQLYNIVELEDPHFNRIGQWLNTTSSGKFLQLFHPLNTEAPKGTYQIIVWIDGKKIYHSFKVDQYVLPKFEIKLNLDDEIGVGQDEYKVEVCAKYTYGQPVPGKAEIKAVHFNDTPIADLSVYLFEGKWSDARRLLNLTTDIHGVASFSINTTGMSNEDIYLRVSNTPEMIDYAGYRTPYFNTEQHTLSVIQPTVPHSKTSSYLDIQKIDETLECEHNVLIAVQYTIVGETIPSGAVDVIYLALSRGAIVGNGHKKVIVQESSVIEGEVTIELTVVPEMAPMVQILVYSMLPSGTVIAHSMNFPTEKCFRNKVSLEFSPSEAVPGEKNTMQLTAMAGSLCGLSAVDRSVHVMVPGKRLDAGKIFDLLPVTEAQPIPYELEDSLACLQVRPKRYILPHPRPNEEKNLAYEVFKKLGLKLATNLIERLPSCLTFQGEEFYHSTAVIYATYLMYTPTSDRGFVGPKPIVKTVRTFFPETWIWDLVEVSESGSADISLTVPDTITTWETEAFCLASGGFGLAPPVEITVFQPFFLELTLPYSIIRGENFELKATIFNYLSKCIMVAVTPAQSLDYTLTPVADVLYTSCVCANERKTLSWTMSPSVLGVLNVTVSAEAVQSHVACNNEIVNVPDRGRIDVVTRSLIVKAEGTEQTDTHNWLLCPTGDALTEEVEVKLPEILVDGSTRSSISVLGDILGRALKNLDGLLQMPYGCGEQNMALLAPNIYILEYLRNTEQLTPAINDKATTFLTKGYQRQLNYKHADGAYSTFGQGLGNTWLSAFVLRSFGKAQSFIYIDPSKIAETKTWLETKQNENGCFLKLGKLFNNRMKGGVTDEVTLTAYITASLLELNHSSSDPVVHKSLSCLRNSTTDLSNTYTTALLAYTFTLAGDMETRTTLLQHLDKIASQEGGLLHWTQTSSETSSSLAVEISSYVLLASLNASPLSTADLGYASRIVRWLVRQQNSYGGFSSTQDTVVALQALALYSTKVFSKEGSSTVTVQAPTGEQHVFDVNQNNKLLYQERHLQDVAGKYTLEVKGSACASVQLSVHYNIPTPTVGTSLSVQVEPVAECNSDVQRKKVTLKLKFQYDGKEQSTNMIIVDVKILSGFSIVPESLEGMKVSLVERIDTKDDHVLMYLSGIKAVHFNDTPIADLSVYLFEGKWSDARRLLNLTTDIHGVASFSINTTGMSNEDIYLRVSNTPEMIDYAGYRTPYFNTEQHTLSVIQPTVPHSKTSSYLDIQKIDETLECEHNVLIAVQYTIVGETIPSGAVDVIYLALSRGAIVGNGHKKVIVQESSVIEGEVTIELTVVPEMAPMVQILVYSMLPSGTVIAHSMNFPTEKCFRNKVSLEFSPSEAVPGEKNTMQLTAMAGSLCGLSAVDRSVHVMVPGKRLDAGKTDDSIRHAVTESIVKTVRTFFPETWIWDLVEVSESGSADISLTVPDTITTWETEAFCLASGGFGLAPPVEITVFQPFFLELTLPYSIIRGENFELKATIFNYLSKCVMVAVTPAQSLDYTLTPVADVLYTSCLCANERKTLSWTMSPSVLGVLNVTVSAEAVQSHVACNNEIVNVPDRGRIDVVTRSLIVKAEGTEQTDTHNWLLCPTGDALTEEVEVKMPEILVDGSTRSSISVLGDILGRALKNLDGLLQMPYGCGEQNMALLAPNIYILEYLRNTEQLTPAINDKATTFLTKGYQRQLNYKHADGAYSTFGQGLGNTWLSAFVLRSFGKAQSFIYIDPSKIAETKTWLETKQNENGCFLKLGKLFNNRMKGGVTDEVTLTAYITASLLELNHSSSDPVVHKSLSCLRNSTTDLSNTYTTALLAYTFTLAGDMEMRTTLLQHLDKIASQEGGLLHWTQTSSETSSSLAVEISSYVLLASLNASPLSTADLGYASRIVRWLVRQQNSYGGFSSTQDTVVALQALALYSTKVFSKEGSSTVTVQAPTGEQHVFDVNQNNKLLYQERHLQDVAGKYTLEVKGSACASVQLSVHYNIPTPTVGTSLSVQVEPVAECNSDVQRKKVTLKLKFQYDGKEQSTNMIIVDVKILSGFSIVPESLEGMKDSLVERIDTKDDHVLMYLSGLQSGVAVHRDLDIVQQHPVQNLKPAVVKIYDYYQPSDQAETEYIFPCAVDLTK